VVPAAHRAALKGSIAPSDAESSARSVLLVEATVMIAERLSEQIAGVV
jgi:hypothetical protein